MRNVFDGSEIQDVAELTQMLNDVDVCSASWPTWDAKRALSSLPFPPSPFLWLFSRHNNNLVSSLCRTVEGQMRPVMLFVAS